VEGRPPDGRPSDSPADRAPAAPAGEAPIDEVIYELTGGFAGFQLELRIQNGGEAMVYDAGQLARRGELTSAEWQELVGLIEAAALPQLASEYGRVDRSMADAMRQVVSVRSRGGTVSVATAGGPDDGPPESYVALARRLMELALTLPASLDHSDANSDHGGLDDR
jgi:hypothetical protein